MKKLKYVIITFLYLLVCFTGCSNNTENESDSGEPRRNASFSSIEEIEDLVAAAKESEEALQKYWTEFPNSYAKLNIFWPPTQKDVFTFEEYVKRTELPVVTEAAMTILDRMKIDYSSLRERLFDCIYYIDGVQYRFMYWNSSAVENDFPEAEKEFQLDGVSFGMYKDEEYGWYQGHTMIGEYPVTIRVVTLDIDSITFEYFTLEKILE